MVKTDETKWRKRGFAIRTPNVILNQDVASKCAGLQAMYLQGCLIYDKVQTVVNSYVT
jgi:hypothetical protein